MVETEFTHREIHHQLPLLCKRPPPSSWLTATIRAAHDSAGGAGWSQLGPSCVYSQQCASWGLGGLGSSPVTQWLSAGATEAGDSTSTLGVSGPHSPGSPSGVSSSRASPRGLVSFIWFISGQENFLHISWFPQSEHSAEQGRVARPHMTRSLRSQRITPTGFLVTPHRPVQIQGWGGLEFSSQWEGKQRTIFNLPKSALWAQSVYMPFIGKTHPTSLGAPTKQTGPHSSLHWPCPCLASLKSRITSSSQHCLPMGVPGVAHQRRALRPLKTCDPDLVI